MRLINEYLSTKVKPSIIEANDDNIDKIVRDEILRFGIEADLNHIDVSNVTSIYALFDNTINNKFNGDISQWNVSKVTNMEFTFKGSKFNGDISKWDVSNVRDMSWMFKKSKFTGDISQWNVSNVRDMGLMFSNSKFNGDISNWKINNVRITNMFDNCPLEKNPPKWYIF